jgi:sodium-dependent dicarboxylate transporter 2/3/5
VVDEKTAYSLFGNTAVFFILGAFIIAAAMMKTGLSMRLSLLVLGRFGRSPKKLVAGVLITSASMAFIMPEHAVAAIMFPVIVNIAGALELEPMRSRYGILLFLSLAWGSIIGGIATLLGGARNPLAIGLLSEYYSANITFFYWMSVATPLTIILLFLAYIVLVLSFPIDVKDVSRARLALKDELEKKGSISRDEVKVGAIIIATLFLWIFFSHRFGLANIALLSSVLLFVLGIMDWKDVEDYVNWGVVLMYGGAIALGSALVSTGAAHWLANLFLSRTSLTPFTFLLTLSIVSLFLTEGISNTAAVAILLPIGFSVGQAIGINPIATVFIVALPSGLAFTLPIATPPIKPGLILNILSWIAFVLMALIYWQYIGLKLI